MDGVTQNSIKKKVLLVDDDEILRDIYEAIFKEEGFDVTVAGDGAIAWDIMTGGTTPDVVFTGINMPNMSGFELIAKMRGDPRFTKIPVAVSSHKGLQEHETKAKELRVDDFIFQGTTPPLEVVKRIKMLVGVKSNFRIAILPHEYDGKALIGFLNTIQGTHFTPETHQRIILELEAEKGENEFVLRLTEEEERGSNL